MKQSDSFMNETLPSVAKEGFHLHESENIHLDCLQQCEIFIESCKTRFGENVIERAPKYELIKQIKNSVFFVKNLCKKCLVFS